MSGTQQIPPIPLRFEGAENVQRTIDALLQRIQTLEAAGKNATGGMSRLRTSVDDTGGSFRNVGQQIGQAGFQLQDFTIQVQNGTNWLTALSQQGSQFLGVFGTGGAIAGAALAMAAVAAQMGGARSAAEQLTEALTRQKNIFEAANDAAERYREGRRREAEEIVQLTTYYGRLTVEMREAERLRLTQSRANLYQAQMDRALAATSRVNNLDAANGIVPGMPLAESQMGLSIGGPGQLSSALQQATALVREFHEQGVYTAQTIDTLIVGLRRVEQAGGPGAEAVVRLRAEVEAARPSLVEGARAIEQNAAQSRALEGNAQAAAAALGGLGEAARLQLAPLTSLQRDLDKVNVQLAAIRTGGLAGLEAANRTRTIFERAGQDREEEIAHWVRQGLRPADAAARADETPLADRIGAATLLVNRQRELAEQQERLRKEQQERDAADRRAAAAARAAARRPDPELLAGWQAVQDQERDRYAEETRQTREWEQEQERIEREAERARERAIQANRRVTDNIVSYTADAFADMFDKNGKGWEGMLDTFESTFRRMLARIAAEAIIRPVVEPIVSGLGLGSLGTGNGGLSGLFGGSVSVGSGSTSGVATGGGLTSMFGGGSGGGGMFRNIGGYVSNPIWQQGIGWFQPSQVAYNDMAGTLNAASSAAPWMFPGGFQTTGAGSSTMLGSMGSVSAGTYVAAIGGGYTAGSMLGGYLAKTDAQRTNSQIGSAGGAAAGAMIGAAVGGPFAPVTAVIGGLIGGLAGGAGGGLIGPSSAFSGGDVGIGVGPDGYLRITGTGGKNWNSAQAQQAAQQQIDQLNAVLRGAGVSIQGVQSGYSWRGGDTLGFMGSGGSSNVFGPTEIFNRVSSGLTTSNTTLAAALRAPWMQSFEDLSVIAPYAAQNDNLTRALASSGIRSRDDFNTAAQWISGVYEPMVKAAQVTNAWEDALAKQNATYDEAIAKARELGLVETDLVAAREKSLSEALRQRNAAVHDALSALRIDELRATGKPADARQASILEYNLSSAQRLRQMQEFLTSNGYVEGSDLYTSAVSRLNALFNTERKSLLEQLNASTSSSASNASGRSLMEEITLGGLGGLSSAGQYAAGQKILADAKRSGDLDTYSAAARSVLTQARGYLGTSERYGALVADVSRTVRGMGGDPVGLSSMLLGQSATNDNLERIYGISNSQLSELKALRSEVATLNSIITALVRRQTAA